MGKKQDSISFISYGRAPNCDGSLFKYFPNFINTIKKTVCNKKKANFNTRENIIENKELSWSTIKCLGVKQY